MNADDVKQRAIDFVIKKFCDEEARKAEEYNTYLRTLGGAPCSLEYNADRDFQWIKDQQKAYKLASQSGIVIYENRAFQVFGEAETLVLLLLDNSAKAYHRSTRAANKQRAQLKWFEESSEFKSFVSSALTRVCD